MTILSLKSLCQLICDIIKRLFCNCRKKQKRKPPCVLRKNNASLQEIDRKTDLLPIIDLKLSQLLSKTENEKKFNVADWLYALDK